ncbi:protein of unknown function (plasmid) [Azospirillum baldaniorum]|uniref:Uncharacterized protein n=1 Tax=Azospirillum baldaniorum TaxID=1064539 RepID=A0A9P1NQR0_9PROT|nr:protein of unknown function [Azospirillum baldaniorum]
MRQQVGPVDVLGEGGAQHPPRNGDAQAIGKHTIGLEQASPVGGVTRRNVEAVGVDKKAIGRMTRAQAGQQPADGFLHGRVGDRDPEQRNRGSHFPNCGGAADQANQREADQQRHTVRYRQAIDIKTIVETFVLKSNSSLTANRMCRHQTGTRNHIGPLRRSAIHLFGQTGPWTDETQITGDDVEEYRQPASDAGSGEANLPVQPVAATEAGEQGEQAPMGDQCDEAPQQQHRRQGHQQQHRQSEIERTQTRRASHGGG